MKKIVIIVLSFIVIPTLVSAGSYNVKGHWRDTNRDGVKDTYVQPHQRTSPNNSRLDNYSYPGRYNPNTGQSTPQSTSPRDTYPANPNPYDHDNPYRIGR